ncbi:MAG: aldo/keto reductase [Candidatus Promineifilaceae bacterium]|nr:aldo/keto reductase [Candidatus Promineifilaceae bacterium]
METRRFGRTGHASTVAIFGAFALSNLEQDLADEVMEQIIAAGVNHIDVAPTYGDAEERLGPWMVRERERFFLGCKTMERDKDGAAAEMRRSLDRLRVDRFDLYQIHAVTNMEELDAVTRPGGALEALVEARDAGLTRFIGITGHGREAPAVFLEALERFDFDSVLFPVNFIQYAQPDFREDAEALLRVCQERDVGVMAIKAIAQGPYGDQEPTHNTWYEPFTEPDIIQDAVNFVLSQPVTGLCTPGDARLLPPVLQACENFVAMDDGQQEALIATGTTYEPLFT